MPTLRQILETLPHRDLRGIATRLNVRRRDENHKEAWIAAIWSAWHDPHRRPQLIAGLSPAAYQAALRLAHSGDLPAALFLAEYGPVRRPKPGQHWSPPPWEQPATVGEELYYCGLLAPVGEAPLEKAARLTIPADLAPLFKPVAEVSPPASLPGAAADLIPVLLHDVAQALCFLAGAEAAGSLRLLHDRWLPPAALADLNHRLLRSQPAPPRSHAHSRWLRFLFFLVTAAGLQRSGRLTASGWVWLAEPPAARLKRLWNAWRSAPLSLRQAYRQPTAVLPEPWPDLALKHVADLPSPFTAGELSQTVLGREQAYTAYFTAHLADLSDLDAAAADLLAALAGDWGILISLSTAANPAYQLTDLGRWLLAGAQDDPPVSLLPSSAAPAAQLQAAEDGHWDLLVSPWATPIHQAQLAPYARYVAFSARHIYRLDADTVAAAAAQGYELPGLLAAMTDLGVELAPDQVIALQGWHARGRLLQITDLPLLRAADRETMAQVMAHPEVRAGLGDLLSPTVALIAVPPAELARRLRNAGFHPQLPVPNPQPPTPNPQPSAVLWLAGRLYAALGELIPLPLPPPFADLSALLEGLSSADRAAVQAQWEALNNGWRGALDGQTSAPSPQPTDPDRWRPAIEAAIAAGCSLSIRYFTAPAGRTPPASSSPSSVAGHRECRSTPPPNADDSAGPAPFAPPRPGPGAPAIVSTPSP